MCLVGLCDETSTTLLRLDELLVDRAGRVNTVPHVPLTSSTNERLDAHNLRAQVDSRGLLPPVQRPLAAEDARLRTTSIS